MNLTDEEKKMLQGHDGDITARMMKLLVRLGEIYGADRMIPVRSVQVSGISYKSIGEPGLEFLKDIAAKGAICRALTYLNPAGMDLQNWKSMNIPEDFACKQIDIINSFRKMGAVISATCTPYLAGNLPVYREHIAWSESSAVSYANSVLGARTNREGGPSALAAAICGRTPNYGLHIDENRKPGIVINVNASLRHISEFGALGHLAGSIVNTAIPFFKGINAVNSDQLKALGAAMASSGSVAMYYIEGITPESHSADINGLEVLSINRNDIENKREKLCMCDAVPDIVILGCPHASLSEVESLSKHLAGKKLKRPLWICTSREVKNASDKEGYTGIIEKAGGLVVTDTCMVVSPLAEMGYKVTGVNSGKAANYLPGFCKQEVVFDSMAGLIRRIL